MICPLARQQHGHGGMRGQKDYQTCKRPQRKGQIARVVIDSIIVFCLAYVCLDIFCRVYPVSADTNLKEEKKD
jgi:hypothetical protein